MVKKLVFFLILIVIFSCQKENSDSFSIVAVEIQNQKQLDSIIIYDKSARWRIESCLRFAKGNTFTDTLQLKQKRIYQLYSFTNGVQAELGELLLSPNGKVKIGIDENKPFQSISYKGSFQSINNALANSKKHQNELTLTMREGISEQKLQVKIDQKRGVINAKLDTSTIADSLKVYISEKFDAFSDVLKKKNLKYLYKASLIDAKGTDFLLLDSLGNSISLKDFKGKYIYLDVWATWCKPCKVEYEYLKELENNLTGNNKMQIISISVDSSYEKWKDYLRDNSIHGKQLFAGWKSDFVKFYAVGALPRFIFLDKEGLIISPDELRPSNPKLLKRVASFLDNSN